MIASLTPDDEDAAVALWDEAGLVRPQNDPRADFRRALEGDSSVVLGVSEHDVLVGTAMVGDDGHRGWVYYLAVAPDVRGKGYGRALMGAAERWLAARGVAKIQFMVRADNAAVGGFYDHLGYDAQDVVTRGRRLEAPEAKSAPPPKPKEHHGLDIGTTTFLLFIVAAVVNVFVLAQGIQLVYTLVSEVVSGQPTSDAFAVLMTAGIAMIVLSLASIVAAFWGATRAAHKSAAVRVPATVAAILAVVLVWPLGLGFMAVLNLLCPVILVVLLSRSAAKAHFTN